MTIYQFPFDNYDASDPFGNRQPPRDPNGPGHLGIDFPQPAGTPIPACASGVVIVNQWSSVLGWVLGVRNDDSMHVGYSHQLVRSPMGVNSRVTIGQTIGQVGSTGTASRGNHLHLSLGPTSSAIFGTGVIDPYAYIQARIATQHRNERDMLLFHTDNPTAPRGIMFHIITADGREAAFTSGQTDFPNAVAGQLGSSIKTDRSLLDSLKTQLKASAPTIGKVEVDNSAIIKALAELATALGIKLDALPAEIDRYADGRKNAS